MHDLLDYLISEPNLKEKYQVIVIDSLSAVEEMICEQPFAILAAAKSPWDLFGILKAEHLKVIRKLKTLSRRGLHVIATMPIKATFDSNGLYMSAEAIIKGTINLSQLAGCFDEMLMIAVYDGLHYFQMDACLTKTAKSKNGEERTTPFYPRINGLNKDDIAHLTNNSNLLRCDLAYILELKQDRMDFQDK